MTDIVHRLLFGRTDQKYIKMYCHIVTLRERVELFLQNNQVYYDFHLLVQDAGNK